MPAPIQTLAAYQRRLSEVASYRATGRQRQSRALGSKRTFGLRRFACALSEEIIQAPTLSRRIASNACSYARTCAVRKAMCTAGCSRSSTTDS